MRIKDETRNVERLRGTCCAAIDKCQGRTSQCFEKTIAGPIRRWCEDHPCFVKLVLPPLFFLAIILLQFTWTKSLSEASVNLIKQKVAKLSKKSPARKWAWDNLQYFGAGTLDFGLMTLLLTCKSRRPRVAYYGIMLSAKFAAINCLKLIYMAPRPYFEIEGLKKAGVLCSSGFGNPSGVSVLTTAFTLALVLDFVRHFLAPWSPCAGEFGSARLKELLGALMNVVPYLICFEICKLRFEHMQNKWD